MKDQKKMEISNDYCIIDCLTYQQVIQSFGIYYNKLSKIDAHKITDDCLNPKKSLLQAELLLKYTDLYNKKVLEIGSGFGVNHIVWTKKYNIDGYGIEPDSEGFESSYKISKNLVKRNGLDENRIVSAFGESIPFEDNTFDVIYSTTVLEHVQSPLTVLDEALRVLKPGGILQIVYPNYHSYYEGHYSLFTPPILFKRFLPWYVKWVWRRDPSFAKTLRTELNPGWTKKTLKQLNDKYDFEIITLGKEIFFERMNNLNFEGWAGLYKIKKILEIVKKMKINIALARMIFFLDGYNPIILTVRKEA